MLKESREIKTFRHSVSASVTKACRFAMICHYWHIVGSDFFP